MSAATTCKWEYIRTDAMLFVAFELGLREWKLGFTAKDGRTVRRRTIAARDLEAVHREIDTARGVLSLPTDAPVVSCYEAGRDGFWLHRALTARGIHNLVVDPGSLAHPRRGRGAKTDRIDLANLLRALVRYEQGEPGGWSVVAVPRAEDEDARHLHRELRALKQERTRHVNRIKGWLIGQGIFIEALPKDFATWVGAARLWNGKGLPAELRGRLEREHVRWMLVDRQIRTLEQEQRERIRSGSGRGLAKIRQLQELRGIGTQGAWILVRELFGWRTFANRRELAALAGLVPVPHQSGEEDRDRGLTHEGNRYVRGITIELAWMWLRLQPRSDLSRWYQQRIGHGGRRMRKVGIAALARKLLIALWRYLEWGVLPEGAELKSPI
jgi:transposase